MQCSQHFVLNGHTPFQRRTTLGTVSKVWVKAAILSLEN
jgi:hypothetical protein